MPTRQVWYVALPSIKPTIVMMFIFAVGGMLNANSEMILLLYNPATYETADVIGAYPLTVKGLKGRKFLVAFLLILMYFSGGIIPSYLLMSKIGLCNNIAEPERDRGGH